MKSAVGLGNPALLDGFEGEITVSATGKASLSRPSEPASVLTLLVKNKKFRADIPGSTAGGHMQGYGVLNLEKQKALAVLDSQKQVIEIDLNTLGEKMKAMAPPSLPRPNGAKESEPAPQITKTGKTDKVAGYTCENWDITSPSGEKGSVCVAEEGNSWFHVPLTGAPAKFAAIAEIMDGKHVPLRFIGYDKSGAEEGRIEIAKIEKKPLTDAQFEPPAGYAVTNLEELMKGMMMPGMMGAGMPGMPPGMTGGMPRRFPPGMMPPGTQPGGMGNLPPGFPPGALPSGFPALHGGPPQRPVAR
jgi:hypothetical protein